jgi:pSer/pThr/pTyr-binding forkhead associated (FHA) protein
MVDPQLLSEFSAQLAEPLTSNELDQRLGLYRVFVKLYDHHRSLLNEVLDLENSSNETPLSISTRFVQGVVYGSQVYLMTNLLTNQTQMLSQPQNVWTIGRDRKASLTIQDKRISRQHAAFQYIEQQGFYLVDLKSTNGTFVNGESIHQGVLLRDGDKVRLGSLSFIFFICQNTQQLDSIPSEMLAQITALRQKELPKLENTVASDTKSLISAINPEAPLNPTDETSEFFLSRAGL